MRCEVRLMALGSEPSLVFWIRSRRARGDGKSGRSVASERAFARKASGLVGVSLLDAFGFGHSGWVRLDDPLANLPPTAQRLLAAAQRLLDRDGFAGLTLQRIADEAEEHKSLIAYHFGSKNGLVAVLADSLWHDADVELVNQARNIPAVPERRIAALVGMQRRFALEGHNFRRFFDIFPYVVRDKELRQRLARLYDWYREIGLLYVGANEETRLELEPLACLQLAVAQGLALLGTIDREAQPLVEGAFALWQELLEERLGEEPTPPGTPDVRPLAGAVEGLLEPGSDPASSLAPMGVKLLAAAQRVLRRRGLAAVTLDAVASAAGEPRSSVWYYFGDKRTLVQTLVEARTYSLRTNLLRRARSLPGDEPRASHTIQVQESLLDSYGDLTTFFELLPAILRDEELRAREALFQAWLRALTYYALYGRDTPRTHREAALAAIVAATPYGLAIQLQLEPKSDVAQRALALWEEMLSALVEPGAQPATASTPLDGVSRDAAATESGSPARVNLNHP